MTEKELNEKIRIYSQKYILPMYLKDELGNLDFVATLTLVKYKDRYFAITAAHAIPADYDLNLGIFVNDRNILTLTQVHRFDNVCDLDLLVLDFAFPIFYEDRCYYNLDEEYPPDLVFFNTTAFSWHGFPKKTSIDFHKKPVAEMVLNSIKNGLITTAKSLLVGIPFKERCNLSNEFILGEFSLKNAVYDKAGTKSKGYSLQGMSGGALCIHKKHLFPLENSFYFVGMGIEHRKDNTIVGINRSVIVEKLDEISNKPIDISIELMPI
ncbi:hypothetical protein [Mannheimia indoligenes]|uniref:hypothetical protein n=1 Tax=Mannheimia indoligenes TaxID=3103145 RepID=UPI002FE5242D